MLGKLLKYECKATARVFLPLYGVLLVLAAINRVFTSIQSENMAIPQVVTTTLLFGFIVAICVISFIVILQRFYKNLLGEEGYLMHTLPAPTWQHIFSKLLVAMMWNILTILVVLASCFFWVGTFQDFARIFAEMGGALSRFFQAAGASGVWSVVLVVLNLLLWGSFGVLFLYGCMAIGSQFGGHKLAASFVAYLALGTVMQILTLLVFSFVPGDNIAHWLMSMSGQAQLLWGLGIFAALAALLCAGFFFGTNYLLKKRLNLE